MNKTSSDAQVLTRKINLLCPYVSNLNCQAILCPISTKNERELSVSKRTQFDTKKHLAKPTFSTCAGTMIALKITGLKAFYDGIY